MNVNHDALTVNMKARLPEKYACASECTGSFLLHREAMLKVKDAQRFAEIAQEAVHDRRESCQRLAVEYATAEEYLNEGLGCISDLVRETAAAAHSLSRGKNERDSNEVRYLHEALDLPGRLRTRVSGTLPFLYCEDEVNCEAKRQATQGR